MDHYSQKEIEGLFSPQEVIEIVIKGIKDFSDGKYEIPERTHISRNDSTKLIMPAFGIDFSCTKLISVNPNNLSQDLPVISGILVLNRSQTGEILCTMDAPSITALRTAAVGNIGADLIHPEKCDRLGVIGLGVQGYWQIKFMLSRKTIPHIYAYSRSPSKFTQFKERLQLDFPNVKFHWCSSAEEVVQLSEIIFTCTTSQTPVFNASGMDLSTKHFISVGSFTKQMQELPEQVYRQTEELIIDTETALSEVGDVINAIDQKWLTPQNIINLDQVLAGHTKQINKKTMVFKSVGNAIFDLVLAQAIFEKQNNF
ncbi:MAG: ornithine cyclodeaminase family protein [Saprospiraceae bacterium]|nr:ornithine cyclodeaminase family protein [Saprospiraceae bacterium]